MTARPDPNAFALDRFLAHQERKDLLRFVACGSVDHGKSTLIGRLLYGADVLFEDQRAALAAESRKHGTQASEFDYSLLLDGLAAEREQNITIDVAYRFFATERRKFIVADTPGHEQYTRNMATGASTADLALVLVSAEAGLTRQTKRHAMILATVDVRHLVVAVNKMDLVGWSQDAFRTIEAEFRAFAAAIGVNEIACIPLSARRGDNVVAASPNMDWYGGPTLLAYLEDVPVAAQSRRQTFRMPIQLVNRPSPQFRGYSGRIAGGEVFPGMPVTILPSGQISSVDRIVTYDGDLERAAAGQSVTITLADQIDASRGDVIAALAAPPAVVDRLTARVVWMGKDALAPGRSYLIKAATATAKANVEPAIEVFDLDTGDSAPADRLFINDIGDCVLTLDRPLALDPYADSKETGSFILIDPESFDTVGMGLVQGTAGERQQHGRLRRALRWIVGAASAGARKRSSSRESRLRSIVKAISWRGTGSVDTFIVTFIVTGNYTFAGSVALTEIATKVMLYYFHERVWSLIPWGR
ncbi:MAG TPA: GTP-binding protein [Xanthobacteraceae bacterium]|nr:GTP-binding protein [Xanthobacteraceae bacterium]